MLSSLPQHSSFMDIKVELEDMKMARRYSASEKAKWTAKSNSPVRRAPVQIPRTDNSELIEQNKLTLIGHVSNPAAKNTHALGPTDGPLRSFNPSRDRDHRDARRYVSTDHRRAYAPSPPRRSKERRKEVWIPRTELSDLTPKSDPRATGRLSVKTARQLQISEVSHTPTPRPPREPMIPAAGTHSVLSTSRDRRPTRERISPALSLNVSSERRPTVERLSLSIHRDSLPLNKDDRIRSDLRQVLENRCIEEQVGDTPLLLGTRTLGPQDPRTETSPILTLSENRLHVSMRIGPLPVEPDSFDDLGSLPKRSGRLAAKEEKGRKVSELTKEKASGVKGRG
ncbi:hypothetical protein DY000_02037320 [Brassica cretica]|uniref:DUF3741 domain-containing protein n=1 Tax=Brassica cretica TaxID=69181 RepID=A0ABQ7BMP8_BRACR|nr:hypothetical protein DY000_02037320 [Brassica cretica]